jgi:nitroimidazol reductase NimA-like FMN-containing flavoprotein (pyridoxamine 5'-phosphate oxidase superfamily)
MPFDEGLTLLNPETCLSLLSHAHFARIGVSVDALPAIVPVWITLLDESIVFRTVPGTKLSYAATGSVLAVEVDEFDASGRDGWSVLVRGVASELTNPDDIARARDRLAGSWIDGAAEHFVGVSLDLVTGRRLRNFARTETSPDAK